MKDMQYKLDTGPGVKGRRRKGWGKLSLHGRATLLALLIA